MEEKEEEKEEEENLHHEMESDEIHKVSTYIRLFNIISQLLKVKW